MTNYDDDGPNGGAIVWAFLSLALVVIAFLVWAFFFHPNAILKKHIPQRQFKCIECHKSEWTKKHQKLAQYFKRKGSPCPEEMSHAVLTTKSPRLMSAIAKCESGGDYRIRSKGYKLQHDGAFQVNPKHWGKVPYDAVGQALQAETVLEVLVKEHNGNIKKALNAYGGDRTRRTYAKNILAELENVPR